MFNFFISFFISFDLPHLIWLIENDYTTITYALNRTGTEDTKFFRSFYLIH